MTIKRTWSILVPVCMLMLPACGGGSTTSTSPDAASPGSDSGNKPDSGNGKDSGGGGHKDSGGGKESGGSDSAGGEASTQEGGNGEGGSEGGTFSVATLPGLALWLDAAKGITMNAGGSVSTWADQSTNGNDATNAVEEPVYVASDFNGLPGLSFMGGTHLTIADSATSTLRFGTGDFFVAVVLKWSGTTLDGLIYSKQIDTTSPYYGVGMFANFSEGSASTSLGLQTSATDYVQSAQGLNDGKPILAWVARGVDILTVSVAGVATTNPLTVADDADAPDFPAYIGASPTGEALTGDIAEMIAVKGTISAADLTSLEAYLNTKYGL